MKHRILGILLVVMLCIGAFPASAQTVEELQARITALLLQVQQLQLQVLQTKQQTTSTFCFNLEKDLQIGAKGNEVIMLHQALNKLGFFIGKDEEGAGSYGEATASAVTGFQEKYRSEILDPLKLNHGSGYLGKRTRDVLKRLLPCTPGTNTAPVVVSVAPSATPEITGKAKITSFAASATATANQPTTLTWQATELADATISATCPKDSGVKILNTETKTEVDCSSGVAVALTSFVAVKGGQVSIVPTNNQTKNTVKFTLALTYKGKTIEQKTVSVIFSPTVELPQVISTSASPNPVSSGQPTTIKVLASGSVTHYNLFVSCPDGVTATKTGVCGNWQTITSFTNGYSLTLKNTSSATQAAAVTVYAYNAAGVSNPSQLLITVTPQ